MATLEAALSSALEGSGRVVGVMAEPGTGKSRLCLEFAERCRARGITVREAHALPHGKSIPFLTILEFMRDFLGVTERDTDEEARHKIAGRVLLLDEALKSELPILFDFLAVPDPKRPSPAIDPEAHQKRLVGLFRRLMQARSREEPAVALFEDMHWIDPGSETFLESVMETVAGTRTLLLFTFRPEYRAEWMSKTFYQQIPLLPLGPEAIAEMLRDLLGEDRSVAVLCARIADHTGGNPFFIEEVVQSLVEAKSLEGKRGAYKLVGSLEALALPPTVQAVLAARIDRLPEREKQLLYTAAVIGKRFAEGVLGQVANLPDVELASALHALMLSEFVYQESLYPEAEYAFKHPLTQEVAYRSQLSERRARLHAEVALALKDLNAEKLDEHAALIAQHWEAAGERLEAARWQARAGACAGLDYPAESLRHWRKVRELLRGVPESPETLALAARAIASLLSFAGRLGVVEREAAELLEEAEALLQRSTDVDSRLRILFGTTLMRWNQGETEESLQLVKAAIALADRAGHAGVRVAARAVLSINQGLRGDLDSTLSLIEETMGLARGDAELGADVLQYSPIILLGVSRGVTLTLKGRFAEAGACLDRATAMARERNELYPIVFCHYFRTLLADALGDDPQAVQHGRRALEVAEQVGTDYSRAFALTAMGTSLNVGGRWEEAIPCLEEALRICVELRAGVFVKTWQLFALARARLGLGEVDRARALGEEAVEAARRQGMWGLGVRTLLVLAHARLTGEGAKARREVEAALDEAQSRVEAMGARAIAPLVLVERARLARALGDEQAFRRAFGEAHRLFHELGATGRVEMIEKEFVT